MAEAAGCSTSRRRVDTLLAAERIAELSFLSMLSPALFAGLYAMQKLRQTVPRCCCPSLRLTGCLPRLSLPSTAPRSAPHRCLHDHHERGIITYITSHLLTQSRKGRRKGTRTRHSLHIHPLLIHAAFHARTNRHCCTTALPCSGEHGAISTFVGFFRVIRPALNALLSGICVVRGIAYSDLAAPARAGEERTDLLTLSLLTPATISHRPSPPPSHTLSLSPPPFSFLPIPNVVLLLSAAVIAPLCCRRVEECCC